MDEAVSSPDSNGAGEPKASPALSVVGGCDVAPSPAPAPGKAGARAANNVTAILLQAAELQRQLGDEIGHLQESVQQQQAELAAAVTQIPDLKERINWLIASYYEQSTKALVTEEKYSQLSTDVAALQQARQDYEIRLESLDSNVSGLKPPVADLSARLEAVLGRLKRQEDAMSAVTGAVRSLCAMQAHWRSALDQVVEILLQAKAASPPVAPWSEISFESAESR